MTNPLRKCCVCGKDISRLHGKRTVCHGACRKKKSRRIAAKYVAAHREEILTRQRARNKRGPCLCCGGSMVGQSPAARCCSAECRRSLRLAKERRYAEKNRELLAERARLRHAKNPGRMNAHARAYYARTREKILARVHADRKANPEKYRQYKANAKGKYRESYRASQRRWNARNRDKLRAAAALWRAKNREKLRAQRRKLYVEMTAAREAVRKLGFKRQTGVENEIGKTA